MRYRPASICPGVNSPALRDEASPRMVRGIDGDTVGNSDREPGFAPHDAQGRDGSSMRAPQREHADSSRGSLGTTCVLGFTLEGLAYGRDHPVRARQNITASVLAGAGRPAPYSASPTSTKDDQKTGCSYGRRPLAGSAKDRSH